MNQVQIYGKTFDTETVQAARETVADAWAKNAQAIRDHDEYASHVTEHKKEENLRNGLAFAESIRRGGQDSSFTVGQRILYELTGECVALLP